MHIISSTEIMKLLTCVLISLRTHISLITIFLQDTDFGKGKQRISSNEVQKKENPNVRNDVISRTVSFICFSGGSF